ncbi:MAG: acyltransferase [Betaproteobacteria bacterium]
MLSVAIRSIRATVSFTLMWINTMVLCLPIYIVAILRVLSPKSMKPLWTRLAMASAETWISINNLILNSLQTLNIEVVGEPALKSEAWYLVIANHQSWTDIVVLQRVFNRKIPMLKFFIKQQLIYAPIIGIAWWVLDFPIMKRFSATTLKNKPHLRGKDIETTKASCERFKLTPVSVLNFLEGTRFNTEKRTSQGSPYRHLLKPKSGGATMVLESLNDRLHSVLDVTLVYHDKTPSFIEFLMGHRSKITVHIEEVPINEIKHRGPIQSEGFNNRQTLSFLQERWQKKDALINDLLEQTT